MPPCGKCGHQVVLVASLFEKLIRIALLKNPLKRAFVIEHRPQFLFQAGKWRKSPCLRELFRRGASAASRRFIEWAKLGDHEIFGSEEMIEEALCVTPPCRESLGFIKRVKVRCLQALGIRASAVICERNRFGQSCAAHLVLTIYGCRKRIALAAGQCNECGSRRSAETLDSVACALCSAFGCIEQREYLIFGVAILQAPGEVVSLSANHLIEGGRSAGKLPIGDPIDQGLPTLAGAAHFLIVETGDLTLTGPQLSEFSIEFVSFGIDIGFRRLHVASLLACAL